MSRRTRHEHRDGFTLLEVLLALTLAGLIIVGGFSALQSGVNTEIRSQDADRVALLARRQMDALMLDRSLPKGQTLEGRFPGEWTPGVESGWRASITPFESIVMPPAAPPAGARMLERIALEIWTKRSGKERVERFESFRPAVVTPFDAQLFIAGAGMGALR